MFDENWLLRDAEVKERPTLLIADDEDKAESDKWLAMEVSAGYDLKFLNWAKNWLNEESTKTFACVLGEWEDINEVWVIGDGKLTEMTANVNRIGLKITFDDCRYFHGSQAKIQVAGRLN
jgi:hypothetical protein